MTALNVMAWQGHGTCLKTPDGMLDARGPEAGEATEATAREALSTGRAPPLGFRARLSLTRIGGRLGSSGGLGAEVGQSGERSRAVPLSASVSLFPLFSPFSAAQLLAPQGSGSPRSRVPGRESSASASSARELAGAHESGGHRSLHLRSQGPAPAAMPLSPLPSPHTVSPISMHLIIEWHVIRIQQLLMKEPELSRLYALCPCWPMHSEPATPESHVSPGRQPERPHVTR